MDCVTFVVAMSFIYSLCAKLTSWGYIFIVQSWVVLIISNSWQEHKSVYVPKNVKLLLNRSCLHTFATGLFRVVECRSEDGHTYCFLCHCCRTRSNRQDIIDHLTKSSHLLNYLVSWFWISNWNDREQYYFTIPHPEAAENMHGFTFKFPDNVCF